MNREEIEAQLEDAGRRMTELNVADYDSFADYHQDYLAVQQEMLDLRAMIIAEDGGLKTSRRA